MAVVMVMVLVVLMVVMVLVVLSLVVVAVVGGKGRATGVWTQLIHLNKLTQLNPTQPWP